MPLNAGALHRIDKKQKRMPGIPAWYSLTGLPCWDWRIISPSQKGSIHKALSLIHHGALDCASHRLPILLACCFWFVGYPSFVQAHLILSRKTTSTQRPHWLSEVAPCAEELKAPFAWSLYCYSGPGSSSIERPSLQRQALKSSPWSTCLISHT